MRTKSSIEDLEDLLNALLMIVSDSLTDSMKLEIGNVCGNVRTAFPGTFFYKNVPEMCQKEQTSPWNELERANKRMK